MLTAKEFFELFLYVDNWNHKINIVFLLVGALYLLLTGPLGKKFKDAQPVSVAKKVAFLFGLIFFYFSMGSPLDLLSHELFSMHMLKMSIEFFVVPPLILWGLPEYLLKALFRWTRLDILFDFFGRPVLSIFFFNGMIWLYHMPIIFDAIMNNELLHDGAHLFMMFAAFCSWWPIMAPLPEMDRLSTKPLLKMVLIVANGVLLTPACAIITFTDIVLFDKFAQMSPLAPILSPIHDQQLGGVIMKITQEIVYIIAIAIVFTRWIRHERAKEQEETLKILGQENPTT